jgi:hypothetical protein
MFVAVDQEVGAAFGPFASNEEAIEWVRDRLLHTKAIALDDEVAAMAAGRDSIAAIQEDLMSMKWFVYEVEYVEGLTDEDEEADNEEPSVDNPWDSAFAGGPYSSHPNL